MSENITPVDLGSQADQFLDQFITRTRGSDTTTVDLMHQIVTGMELAIAREYGSVPPGRETDWGQYMGCALGSILATAVRRLADLPPEQSK